MCVTAPPKVQSVPKQTILSVMIESMTWETNPTVFGLTLLRGLIANIPLDSWPTVRTLPETAVIDTSFLAKHLK